MLSPGQLEVTKNTSRFRVVCAGRRWGKTHLAIRELAKFARYPDSLVYYISPSYRMSKQIAWRKLSKKLKQINWVTKANESELTLYLVNGSRIELKGADNYDSLRGVGLNFVVFDETADIDPETWFEVIRPSLSDQQGHALFIGTPKGHNWFKDLYDLTQLYPEHWASYQFTTLSGGRVPQEEIEAARRDLDARTFSQEYLATFENFQGRVAYMFDRNKHLRRLEKPNTKIIHVGMDFNVHPMSAVVLVEQEGILYAIDEIRIPNSNTTELVLELKNRYPRSEIRAYPDPSGASRKSSSGGQTDHIILRNNHIKVHTYASHKPVKDRIAALNSRLLSESGLIRLFIDPKLKYTIESLERYSYKEDTQIPDKGHYDHMFDALSYCVEYMYPIKSSTHMPPPQRFGVSLRK